MKLKVEPGRLLRSLDVQLYTRNNRLRLIVGQICAKFSEKCSLAVKSTVFAGCLAFDMVMDIGEFGTENGNVDEDVVINNRT